MHRWRLFWSGAFVINGTWAWLLPTGPGRTTGLLGAVIAAAVLVKGLTSREPDSGTRRDAILLAPFLLPILSFWSTPVLAFWSLDGRAWLILAWILASTIAVLRAAPDDERDDEPSAVPFAVGLFIVWASVLWLTVVWDVGIGPYAMRADRTIESTCQSDPLSTIFRVWEQQPATEHLFLAWRYKADSFENRTIYANHVHPYLLTMYAWVSGVRAVTGRPLPIASNTTPFLYIFVLIGSVTVLFARLGLLRQIRDARGLLTLFVGLGFLITTWRFWNDLYRYQSDDTFPLLAALLIFTYAAWLSPMRPWIAIATGTIFVAFAPVHLPMLLVAVVCVFGQPAARMRDLLARNRPIVQLAAWSIVVGVIVGAAPRLLAAWKGYTAIGSSWLFRSGLDGDPQYLSSLFQAFSSPTAQGCYVRPPMDLLWPACVPVVALLPWMSRGDPAAAAQAGRLLLFLASPYLWSLVLFAQSLSIHPYLYDLFLLIPLIVTGVALAVMEPLRRRLAGSVLLIYLLAASALIMFNLIAIAQAVKRMP